MVPVPPPLPTQFPCWCRAVYSWGGESKRDLGFIEGDLIECLNAGDGSWWVGRLYRDRRTVGSFPSNFVALLPEDFRPTTRSASPLPESNMPDPPAMAKSKTFRKPFEAYAKAPHYTSAKQPETFREPPKARSVDALSKSFSKSVPEGIERASTPSQPHGYGSRAPSPAPSTMMRDPYRSHSPAPSTMMRDPYRGHSPAPSAMMRDPYRSHSPAPPNMMRDPYRSHSPAPSTMMRDPLRASSPAPSMMREPPRGPSPAPSMMHEPPRSHSPAPPMMHMPSDRGDSPPPPAPPPHRHVARDASHHVQRSHHDMSRHGSTASYNNYRQDSSNSRQGYHDLSRQTSYVTYGDAYDHRPHTPRALTPGPPSPSGSHMTPSPLREAMDGVMEQLGELQGLGGAVRAPSPAPPLDPWAPESFDLASPRSKRGVPERTRPVTSMGIAHHDEGYETWSGGTSRGTSHQNGGRERPDEHAQLNSYVERMERHFQTLHQQSPSVPPPDDGGMPPPPPPKNPPHSRPKTSSGESGAPERKLNMRKSAHEISRGVGRTYTTKTNATNSSSGNQSNTSASTQSSGRTLWSGASAGGFSSTSAGSYARTAQRAQSSLGLREPDLERPETPFTGVTYHSSHASDVNNGAAARPASQAGYHDDLTAGIGGLVHPKAPKRNIFKKIFESAKTGVASSRGSIAAGTSPGASPARPSPFSRQTAHGALPMAAGRGALGGRESTRETGPGGGGGGGGVDWVQVRRDVNRSNSLSQSERSERRDRCQMMDHPALNPVDELFEGIEGDEGADGMPVAEPLNYQAINLSQVDKNSRFVSEPPSSTAKALATTYICRPYRSDVQRLRAIFTWVAEKICWEEDFEGQIDTRRVIQSKRGCAEEQAVLVMEMCAAVGVQCEVIRGYLKSPGDVADVNMVPRPNHWWNGVVVDGEWRIMDCCLASPSNPKRGLYTNASGAAAEPWWFLARPTEMCWTHVPEHHDQQHIVPPVAHEVLLNLPCTCPAFFRNGMEMADYNTSATRIEDLEMVHVTVNVPSDVEIAAEVEARAFAHDADGDVFESGDTVRKRALAQAEWFNGVKRYTIKALLPGDEGQGTLKIYAGQRGLMHSIKDIPHPLALALPIVHTGENPPYEFVTRYPTPHAQRHDIYVVQPQCQRLALNNTFVFAIRQHPSSLSSGPQSALTPATNPGGATSPIPFLRPGSAMSVTASSVGGSNPSSATGIVAGQKPAKLAIQTPGGKILRLMRKEERRGMGLMGRALGGDDEASDGGTWETIIKCSERGLWRGLVLADRTARWCVFAEWDCVG